MRKQLSCMAPHPWAERHASGDLTLADIAPLGAGLRGSSGPKAKGPLAWTLAYVGLPGLRGLRAIRWSLLRRCARRSDRSGSRRLLPAPSIAAALAGPPPARRTGQHRQGSDRRMRRPDPYPWVPFFSRARGERARLRCSAPAATVWNRCGHSAAHTPRRATTKCPLPAKKRAPRGAGQCKRAVLNAPRRRPIRPCAAPRGIRTATAPSAPAGRRRA